MKIACIADIHLHNFTDFSKPQTVTWDDDSKRFIPSETGYVLGSRLLDTLGALTELRDKLIELGIRDLVLAGDLFHKRGSVPSEVVATAYKVFSSFKKLGIEIYAIPGNHDQVSHSEYTFDSITPFEEIMKISSTPEVVRVSEDTVLCMLPYNHTRDIVLNGVKSFVNNPMFESDKKILVAHLGINGAYVGTNNYAMSDSYSLPELFPNEFKYVILGHYHKHQFLGKNACYTGSPTQNNFNDEGGEHGFVVIDTEKNGYMELVPLSAPVFRTLTSSELPTYQPNPNEFVRVTVNPDTPMPEGIEDNSNIRVEFEKVYSKDGRSELSIVQTWADMITTYASESGNPEAANLGLEILKSLEGEE